MEVRVPHPTLYNIGMSRAKIRAAWPVKSQSVLSGDRSATIPDTPNEFGCASLLGTYPFKGNLVYLVFGMRFNSTNDSHDVYYVMK